MKFPVLVLFPVLLLSACGESQLEKSARTHAAAQAVINVANFERAERHRQEQSEKPDAEESPDSQDAE